LTNETITGDKMASDAGLRLAHYPYHYTTALRQSDSRGNGHVANGKLAALADDAREDVHTKIMGDRMAGHALHIVESNFRFLHEVTYPGSLIIGVGIEEIGNSSLREVLGFFRDDRCYVFSRLVIVKTAGGRSAPLTSEERARAEAFLVRR
jgi:acyl-CoA thioester hydrolase